MMAVKEATQATDANFSIFISRLGLKNFICMSNASPLSVQKSPVPCFLQIIHNDPLLIRINLLQSASWLQFWRSASNACWKCQPFDFVPGCNDHLAWERCLVSSGPVLIYSPWSCSSYSWSSFLDFTACETLLGIEIEQWCRIRFTAACWAHDSRERVQGRNMYS